mgnify:CR=1 FL=1
MNELEKAEMKRDSAITKVLQLQRKLEAAKRDLKESEDLFWDMKFRAVGAKPLQPTALKRGG